MGVDALRRLLAERAPCVVLTGAGISTESGIPDFRSAAGIGWCRLASAASGEAISPRRNR